MKRIVNSGNDNFIIVDSRRESDYLKGHIPKAINIFAEDEDVVVIEKILALSKDKTIIIYCDGGNCDLSHRIASLLENFGYSKFFLYENGWNEWSKNQ
jgi:rhodanese-related sulfurtransferase